MWATLARQIEIPIRWRGPPHSWRLKQRTAGRPLPTLLSGPPWWKGVKNLPWRPVGGPPGLQPSSRYWNGLNWSVHVPCDLTTCTLVTLFATSSDVRGHAWPHVMSCQHSLGRPGARVGDAMHSQEDPQPPAQWPDRSSRNITHQLIGTHINPFTTTRYYCNADFTFKFVGYCRSFCDPNQ